MAELGVPEGDSSAVRLRIGRTLSESTPAQLERPSADPAAPNVVMIVLDDLGFADLGCQGSDIETPTIDGLATSGLRYNSFHVTAICSSTRACLLTGRNHHAVGMGFLTDHPLGFPGYSGRIPRSAGTLPRVLKTAGYATFAVGKWHLAPTHEQGAGGPFDRWPLGLGFDRYYGFLGPMNNQWTPWLVQDNGYTEPSRSPEQGYHLTEDLADRAIRMVKDQRQSAPDQPFFLYFATGAPHYPHHVPGGWSDRYSGRFDEGWEATRARIFDRQRAAGLFPSDTVLTPRPSWVPRWDDLSAQERRRYISMMETYAGFISHTDHNIGRLLAFLREAEMWENTIVMILSDNGASPDGGPHGAMYMDELVPHEREPAPSADTPGDELGGFRSYNHYPWGWAWAGNTPFRLWKAYTWLGGVRTPFIVHWPRGIPSEARGTVRDDFVHAVDLMPTILDVAGAQPPDEIDGVAQQPLEGRSISPSLRGARHRCGREVQYFEMFGSRAIYAGGWKATTDHVVGFPKQRAVVEGSSTLDDDRWSLFDLRRDFSEGRDLAQEHPRRLREMVQTWWYEAGRNQVLPLVTDSAARLAAGERPTERQRTYRCWPDAAPLKVPFLHHAESFTMTANIDTSGGESAGVICAQGDWHAGWACYVVDGYLTATFSFRPGSATRLISSEPLTGGRHEVEVQYGPASAGEAPITLGLDGRELGSDVVPAGLLILGLTGARVVVGRDVPFPVCDDYDPPFAFGGGIDGVTLQVVYGAGPAAGVGVD